MWCLFVSVCLGLWIEGSNLIWFKSNLDTTCMTKRCVYFLEPAWSLQEYQSFWPLNLAISAQHGILSLIHCLPNFKKILISKRCWILSWTCQIPYQIAKRGLIYPVLMKVILFSNLFQPNFVWSMSSLPLEFVQIMILLTNLAQPWGHLIICI